MGTLAGTRLNICLKSQQTAEMDTPHYLQCLQTLATHHLASHFSNFSATRLLVYLSKLTLTRRNFPLHPHKPRLSKWRQLASKSFNPWMPALPNSLNRSPKRSKMRPNPFNRLPDFQICLNLLVGAAASLSFHRRS